MHVLYIHQHFATRSGVGGTRSYEFALRLVEAGHEVTMVTGQRRGGGISDDAFQTVDGINVISLGGYYSNFLGTRQRIQQFLRFTRLARRLDVTDYGLPAPDVVIATSTPLTVGIPGVYQARRHDVPFVFEVRDLWPEAPIQMGVLRDPASKWAARRLERWIYRNADHVIALSPGMAAGVAEAGFDSDRISMIPNCSDVAIFSPELRDRSVLDQWDIDRDALVAVHGGTLGAANYCEYIVRAAAELQRRGEGGIHILFCGDGKRRPAVEALAEELGVANVTFTGSVQHTELGRVVSSCDVAMTSFADLPILATNSPNKLFDGLAAGIPNIVNSAGWTRDLVEEHEAGRYVDAGDPSQLADSLVRYRDDVELRARHGRNARRLALDRFERDMLARRFRGVLEGAAAQAGAPARA